MVKRATTTKGVSWTLFIVSLLLVLTGLGITRQGVITPLTLGLFTKAFSYQIHLLLWGPFLILLFIHVYLFTAKKA